MNYSAYKCVVRLKRESLSQTLYLMLQIEVIRLAYMTLEICLNLSAKNILISISISKRPVVTINFLLYIDSALCVYYTLLMLSSVLVTLSLYTTLLVLLFLESGQLGLSPSLQLQLGTLLIFCFILMCYISRLLIEHNLNIRN